MKAKGKGGPADNPVKKGKKAAAGENYRSANPYIGNKAKKASVMKGK